MTLLLPRSQASSRLPLSASRGYRRCDLCGRTDPQLFLRSPRLDGPLVRCRGCGLIYVGARSHDFTFVSSDAARTAALGEMVDRLGIVDRDLEDSDLGRQGDRESDRLALLLRHVDQGRLLDVGASTGEFLAAAAAAGFTPIGVEPDPGTSAAAQAGGLDVTTGTLDSVGAVAGGYDAVTMFHVIEHLDSPRAALGQIRALLRPGGVVLIETPRVDCAWFALAPGRWRQLIPDHYWFFSLATLSALMRDTGFEVLEHQQASREVSLQLLADRLRRGGLPGAVGLGRAVSRSGLGQRRVRVNPGDIMQVVGRAN